MPGNILFVVNSPDRWPLKIPGVEVVSGRSYLTDPRFLTMRQCKVYNLCRSYRYQSLGYYVSLLAEARGHKPLPRIATTQDMKFQSLIKVVSGDLDALIQKSLAPLQGPKFVLSIYFSRNVAKRYDRLSRQLFNLFPVPLLRAHFEKKESRWELMSISPISANEIPEEHRSIVVELVRQHFSTKTGAGMRKTASLYSMAMLVDPQEANPPSSPAALERFVEAAQAHSISVENIDKDDYGRLAEFDALFLRATTAVNHHTYRFARRAEAEGLVVMDDPTSIVRCTNKVFLAELLNRYRLPMPRTAILHRDNAGKVLKQLGLPCILKQPDSSFSQGVVKVETPAEYYERVDELLQKSELLIAQEFLRTDYDWRVGIIDQKPLYACKYFMARGHWQIYNNEVAGDDRIGDFETFPVEVIPSAVRNAALKAANIVGDGLYGVDLKQTGKEVYIIEVNDNPSIDAGVAR